MSIEYRPLRRKLSAIQAGSSRNVFTVNYGKVLIDLAMKPLIILMGVFAISLFATGPVTDGSSLSLAGRIAMAAMLVFTAIGHFAFVDGMTMMMPEIFPFKKQIVYLTGV